MSHFGGGFKFGWDIKTATVCSFDIISSKLLEAHTGGLWLHAQVGHKKLNFHNFNTKNI